jgi:hypothetical protein
MKDLFALQKALVFTKESHLIPKKLFGRRKAPRGVQSPYVPIPEQTAQTPKPSLLSKLQFNPRLQLTSKLNSRSARIEHDPQATAAALMHTPWRDLEAEM